MALNQVFNIFESFKSLKLIEFTAKKALYIFLMCVILPVVLFNTLVYLQYKTVEFILNNLSSISDMNSITLQVSGIGAYLAEKCHLAQGLAFYLDCLYLRFIISFFKR